MISAQVLSELRALSSGDPDFLRNVFVAFLEMLPERLSHLERAIVTHQAETVTRLAHGLKGSCFNLGAQKMGEICQELELYGRHASLNQAPFVYQRLVAESELVILAIHALPEWTKK